MQKNMIIEENKIKELISRIEEGLQNLEKHYYKDIELIPCLFIEVASKIGALQILNIVSEEGLQTRLRYLISQNANKEKVLKESEDEEISTPRIPMDGCLLSPRGAGLCERFSFPGSLVHRCSFGL